MCFNEKTANTNSPNSPSTMTSESLIQAAADSIMERFKPAFEELAK